MTKTTTTATIVKTGTCARCGGGLVVHDHGGDGFMRFSVGCVEGSRRPGLRCAGVMFGDSPEKAIENWNMAEKRWEKATQEKIERNENRKEIFAWLEKLDAPIIKKAREYILWLEKLDAPIIKKAREYILWLERKAYIKNE